MRTFEHKSYKSCKTCYLTVALFAAAAVFTLCAPFAYGQEKRIAANPDRDDANMGPGIVVLRGDFSAYGSFFFRGNTITYKHGVRDKGSRPGRLKVNGKPYGDLKEPYKLDFKPDFAHAHLREQACDGKVELVVLDDGLELKFDQRKAKDGGEFRIVLSLFDPEQGVKPAEQTDAQNETAAAKDKKSIPSKMDLIPKEEQADQEQDAASDGKAVSTDQFGREKLPSMMDKITMQPKKRTDSRLVFKCIQPLHSSYPTTDLINSMMKIPLRFGRIDGSVQELDALNMNFDRPWVIQQPRMEEEEETRMRRELIEMLFGP
jgi:hypothetical protein